MGSTVVSGRGRAVITATGMDTEMGKIAGVLAQTEQDETPLQRKLTQLGTTLSKLVVAICVFIFIFDLVVVGDSSLTSILSTFMVAVSLAVAAIPEGLATVVTVVLSIGVTNMSKRHAVIRRLTAVETLGCTQVICSDKTGTLTQNKMTVVEHTGPLPLLAAAMTLCNDAILEDGGAQGEPTEAALVNFAAASGCPKPQLEARQPRCAEAPFDSSRKMMSTIHRTDGGFVQYTKGAPDEVLRPQAEPAPAPEPAPTAQETAEPPAARPAAKRQDASADVQSAAEEVGRAIEDELAEPEDEYRYPPITLLDENHTENYAEVGAELRGNSRRLAQTLQSFGVDAQAGEVVHGPSVTRYEFTLDQGVKLSKITNLSDDIALALGASGVRIAPIPNKISVVGIEVPNRTVTTVRIRDVIESRTFTEHRSRVAFAVGKDIGGKAIVGDISKLPHVLIAGTTGSGKSVCTNSLIISMLYKSTPEEVRFIMVDPKMVELAPYNGIPHLLIPVVTDPKKAAGALQWAVYEMMKRYKLFSENGVKDLAGFNALAEHSEELKKMPTVVVVIDELADLMLVAAKEVEESICRVAQMGRAAGMHLVIATQRPSSDVITGLMKANIPSRIAFAVASSLESRIILDTTGAEKLVGKGDMLYFPLGSGKPQRVQGCFISPEEIERVVAFVKETGEADYSSEVMEKIEEAARRDEKGGGKQAASDDSTSNCDELFNDAVEVVLETGQASVSMLQRRLKLGYSRAARLVDQMEEHGIVGPFEGSKPRQLLIDRAKWQERQMGRQAAESAPKPDRFGSIQDVFESHDALE